MSDHGLSGGAVKEQTRKFFLENKKQLINIMLHAFPFIILNEALSIIAFIYLVNPLNAPTFALVLSMAISVFLALILANYIMVQIWRLFDTEDRETFRSNSMISAFKEHGGYLLKSSIFHCILTVGLFIFGFFLAIIFGGFVKALGAKPPEFLLIIVIGLIILWMLRIFWRLYLHPLKWLINEGKCSLFKTYDMTEGHILRLIFTPILVYWPLFVALFIMYFIIGLSLGIVAQIAVSIIIGIILAPAAVAVACVVHIIFYLHLRVKHNTL